MMTVIKNNLSRSKEDIDFKDKSQKIIADKKNYQLLLVDRSINFFIRKRFETIPMEREEFYSTCMEYYLKSINKKSFNGTLSKFNSYVQILCYFIYTKYRGKLNIAKRKGILRWNIANNTEYASSEDNTEYDKACENKIDYDKAYNDNFLDAIIDKDKLVDNIKNDSWLDNNIKMQLCNYVKYLYKYSNYSILSRINSAYTSLNDIICPINNTFISSQNLMLLCFMLSNDRKFNYISIPQKLSHSINKLNKCINKYNYKDLIKYIAFLINANEYYNQTEEINYYDNKCDEYLNLLALSLSRYLNAEGNRKDIYMNLLLIRKKLNSQEIELWR